MAQVRLKLANVDGDLPPVCMCCGEPATDTVTKTLYWHPAWPPLFFLMTIQAGLAGHSAVTKEAQIEGPFCDRHDGHWAFRYWTAFGTFVLWIVLCVGGIYWIAVAPDKTQATIATVVQIVLSVSFVSWVVAFAVMQLTAIRAQEITDTEIVLTGVSPAFVEAVAKANAKRQAGKPRAGS